MARTLLLRLSLLLVLATAVSTYATAQCPMCKISAETNMKNGGTAGQGLNKGILYLFATPYIIIGGLGVLWYRNRTKSVDDATEIDLTAEAQLN